MPAASNKGSKSKLNSNVSPLAIVLIAVLVVGVLGTGVFYLVNGGWQTEGQKKYQFEHETAPLIAAQRGRPELLEQENAKRKAAGQPLLRGEERHERAGNMKQKLQDLQGKMGGGQATGN